MTDENVIFAEPNTTIVVVENVRKVIVAEAAPSSGIAGVATINNQSGITYTLALVDINADVICSNNNSITVTIPISSTIFFPVGSTLMISQGGLGSVTIVGSTGVTLVGPTGFVTGTRYDARFLTQISPNMWRIL